MLHPNKSETEEGKARENKPSSLYLEACRKPWEKLLGVVMKVNFASMLRKRKRAGKLCSTEQSCARFCQFGMFEQLSEAGQFHRPGLAGVFTAAFNEQENPTKFFLLGALWKSCRDVGLSRHKVFWFGRE